MFTRKELNDAIDELEASPPTYQNCEKLATFYTLYDHLYGPSQILTDIKPIQEIIIDDHGESEFLRKIEGREASKIWYIMDELMETVKLLQPRLYEATMQKISE